ncbi:MAG: hypothetical protein H0X17_20135 [Deltaproteobacteria bacterium]|nr:hypothetical protein [Deltaproteobacteria bacterium]
MIKQLVRVACVFGVVFSAACGGGGGSVGPDDLADEVEGASCDQAVRCESVPDRAACDSSTQVEDRDLLTILGAVDDGTIKYDSEAAGDCADFIGDASCSFEGFHTENPCQDIFEGTVAAGGACFVDLQCAGFGECVQTDANCDGDVTCCPGTCMGTFTESPIGGPCDDDLHFCGTTAYCESSATGAGTCTALIADGTACSEIDACANPLYCNLDFTTGTGTCKAAAPSGGSCSRMDLLPCADSREYCDATSKCVKRVAVGGACGPEISCVGYATCNGTICVADLKAGAACVVDSEGPDCLGDLECIGGTCQLPPIGASCL